MNWGVCSLPEDPHPNLLRREKGQEPALILSLSQREKGQEPELILAFSYGEMGQEPVLIQTFSLSTGARGHEKTLTSRNSSLFMSSPIRKRKRWIKLIEGRCVEEDGLRWIAHRVDRDLRVEE